MSIVDILKTIPSRNYDGQTKSWDISLSDYDLTIQKLKNLSSVRTKELNEIPENIRKVCFYVV